MLKKVFMVSMGILMFFASCVFAQQNTGGPGEEKITVTTYYPSPYGVYNEMQLNILYAVPQDPATRQCEKEGQFFYDKVHHILKICDGTKWIPAGGSLTSEIVPCTATSMTVSGFTGWGCTAKCPQGTLAVGGGSDWSAIKSLHQASYSKPTTTSLNGDSWSCFVSPKLVNSELDSKGFVGGHYGCGVDAAGNDIPCDEKILCYAVCGKME